MSEKIVQLNEEVIKGQLIPAVYRPLLPQCVFSHATLQGKDCGQDAQGDPRPGEQESSPAEDQSCGGGTALHETERGRQEGRRWH